MLMRQRASRSFARSGAAPARGRTADSRWGASLPKLRLEPAGRLLNSRKANPEMNAAQDSQGWRGSGTKNREMFLEGAGTVTGYLVHPFGIWRLAPTWLEATFRCNRALPTSVRGACAC